MEKVYTIGSKNFVLDQAKAEEAFAAKRIINGRDTMFFNILPLKYQWAYELYKNMKNNHWEPEDIPCKRTSNCGAVVICRTLSAGLLRWRLDTFQLLKASLGITLCT